jgi:hypothetical protein
MPHGLILGVQISARTWERRRRSKKVLMISRRSKSDCCTSHFTLKRDPDWLLATWFSRRVGLRWSHGFPCWQQDVGPWSKLRTLVVFGLIWVLRGCIEETRATSTCPCTGVFHVYILRTGFGSGNVRAKNSMFPEPLAARPKPTMFPSLSDVCARVDVRSPTRHHLSRIDWPAC